MIDKEKFMHEALKEAKKAYDKEEIPVGAVIVKNRKIIARGHNLKEKDKNAVHHAEIIAINKASKKLDNWRLVDCDMYVTVEPCVMCAGALLSSRIKKVYIGALDNISGAFGSVLDITKYKFNHVVEVETRYIKKRKWRIIKRFF